MANRVALAGNPNCGKTTLFNQLTGSRAHVGNWAGVTVERKEGEYKSTAGVMHIIDLPGIYSLSSSTQEEIIARDYLAQERPELILNIVDATNLERNLFLTTQLIELEIPMVVALNMMDEVARSGDQIDIPQLEQALGVPVMPICAAKGTGIPALMERAQQVFTSRQRPGRLTLLEDTHLYPALRSVYARLKARNPQYCMYHAARLLERDTHALAALGMDAATQQAVAPIIEQVYTREDAAAKLTQLRYQKLTQIANACIRRGRRHRASSLSDKIDRIVTHRFWSIPIFILVMLAVFAISVGGISERLRTPLERLTGGTIPALIGDFLIRQGASPFIHGLVVEGILAGISGVLSILPSIVLLFLCLSILEDSGYMARVAFIMDRTFRRFGLTGRAFIPLLMSFGCAVPAIMAARSLEDERTRRLTIGLIPFMSCSARIPVYMVFASTFFKSHQVLAVVSLYALGIVIALFTALLLRNTALPGEAPPLIIELPPYRLPAPKAVLIHLWEKAKGYLVRVGTILMEVTLVIWLISRFDFRLLMVSDPSMSMLGQIGRWMSPLFTLNGFPTWQASVALITGFLGKEAIIGTLGVLLSAPAGFGAALQGHFTPLAAYSFLVFVLLYTPCVAAVATVRTELKSWKWALFTVVYPCAAAWLLSALVYQLGMLAGLG